MRPAVAPPPGAYRGSVTVTFATATPQAALYYTTDAIEPTPAATPYTAPIALSRFGTYVFRVIATKPSLVHSAVLEVVYAVYNDVVCGDGIRSAGEQCDDGSAANGDGCSAACRIEPNFVCQVIPMSYRDACRCAHGYYGAGCNISCSSDVTCSGHGACGSGGSCKCDVNYWGDACADCKSSVVAHPFCFCFIRARECRIAPWRCVQHNLNEHSLGLHTHVGAMPSGCRSGSRHAAAHPHLHTRAAGRRPLARCQRSGFGVRRVPTGRRRRPRGRHRGPLLVRRVPPISWAEGTTRGHRGGCISDDAKCTRRHRQRARRRP